MKRPARPPSTRHTTFPSPFFRAPIPDARRPDPSRPQNSSDGIILIRRPLGHRSPRPRNSRYHLPNQTAQRPSPCAHRINVDRAGAQRRRVDQYRSTWGASRCAWDAGQAAKGRGSGCDCCVSEVLLSRCELLDLVSSTIFQGHALKDRVFGRRYRQVVRGWERSVRGPDSAGFRR